MPDGGFLVPLGSLELWQVERVVDSARFQCPDTRFYTAEEAAALSKADDGRTAYEQQRGLLWIPERKCIQKI